MGEKKSGGNEFGQRLKAIRLSLNMTQPDMAKKFGTTVRTVASYEGGFSEPKAGVLPALLMLGINLNWFATGQGQMTVSRAVSSPLNLDLLTEAIDLVEEWLEQHGREMDPPDKARAISTLYDMAMDEANERAPQINRRDVGRILRIVK